jgi:hypothetical protein
MTFESLKDRYLQKIGQKAGYAEGLQSEDDTEICNRLADEYWNICRETGCTYRKPTLLTLTATTLALNKHNLETAIGATELPTTHKIFSVRRIYYKPNSPPRLGKWNKDAIDDANNSGAIDTTGSPIAFAEWSEWDTDTNANITYVSFYPYLSEADSTNFLCSYFRRPPQPTIDDWDSLYPEFPEDYHDCIAERAAWKFLRDKGDVRATLRRWQETILETNRLKDKFRSQLIKGERFRGTMEAGVVMPRWYGDHS